MTCHNQRVSERSASPHRGHEFRAARAATNSLVNAAGVVVVLVIALVTTPIALDHLGLVEFGIWSFVTVAVGYISKLDPNFGGMVMRYGAMGRVSGDHKIAARICAVGTLAWLGLALLLSPVLFAIVHPLMGHMGYSPGVRVAAERFFYWTYALIFLGSILSTLSSRLLAVGEQWIVTSIDASTRILYGVVLVWCLTRDMRLSAIIVATTTQYLVAYLATFVVIAVRHGAPYASPRGIPRETRRELRTFSGWFQLNAILDTLTYETDPVVISVLVSPTATGIWSIATRLARQITYFGYIPNGNILPAVSAAVAADEGAEAIQRIYTRASRIITLIGTVMGGLVISCGPVLFLAWLNNPFHEASWATILIALGILAGTPRPVTGAAIFALGKVGLGTRAQAVAFIVNATLTLALVTPFGLNGVLIGTLVAKICATTYLLARFARLVATPARQLIAPWLVRIVLIGTVATVTSRFVMDHWDWALSSRSHAGIAALILAVLYGAVTLLMIRVTHLFTRDDLLWLRGAMPSPLRRLFPDRAIAVLSAP